MRSSWKWYFVASGVSLGTARLLLILFRPHSYPVIDSIAPRPPRATEEMPAEVAVLLEAGIGRRADGERDVARRELSARLLQLAHDANARSARDIAKVAYEADEAVLHGDCARLGDRMRALEELAHATESEYEAALLMRRARAVCDDARRD